MNECIDISINDTSGIFSEIIDEKYGDMKDKNILLDKYCYHPSYYHLGFSFQDSSIIEENIMTKLFKTCYESFLLFYKKYVKKFIPDVISGHIYYAFPSYSDDIIPSFNIESRKLVGHSSQVWCGLGINKVIIDPIWTKSTTVNPHAVDYTLPKIDLFVNNNSLNPQIEDLYNDYTPKHVRVLFNNLFSDCFLHVKRSDNQYYIYHTSNLRHLSSWKIYQRIIRSFNDINFNVSEDIPFHASDSFPHILVQLGYYSGKPNLLCYKIGDL